jgi:hypothetical protein
MRPSASELENMTTQPAASRRPARASTVLAFGVAFALVTLVLFEAGRRGPGFALTSVGPIAGLIITAIGSFISGALFFSSPVMWLGIWALGMPGASEPSWLITAEVVAPSCFYGAIHGAFVDSALAWRQMARAIARRYVLTFLAVGVVGLLLAVVMAVDS